MNPSLSDPLAIFHPWMYGQKESEGKLFKFAPGWISGSKDYPERMKAVVWSKGSDVYIEIVFMSEPKQEDFETAVDLMIKAILQEKK